MYKDLDAYWMPFTANRQFKKAPRMLARSSGMHYWDDKGRQILDGVAGLWSSNLGHSCRPVRDAIVAQLDELPFFNTFRGTTHPRAIELSARVVDMMAPDGVAAVLQAARLGVVHQHPLQAMETGDGLTGQDATVSVPDTLGAALDALEADTALVQAVGAELVANHVFIKRAEIEKCTGLDHEGVRHYYIRHV